MLKSLSKLRAGTTAAAVLAAVAVAAPQAAAAEKPASSVSGQSDAAARAAAAANVCGNGYHLTQTTPLVTPTDHSRTVATLYSYEKGDDKGCAVLGNNKGSKQYMYLGLCKWNEIDCDTNSGMFSEYAGPVYVSDKFCAVATVKMGQSSSSLYLDFKNNHLFLCD